MAKPKKSKITTIKLQEGTKERLDGLKEHERETYDQVIDKTLNIINICIRNPIAGARVFRGIKRKKSKGFEVYKSIPEEQEE